MFCNPKQSTELFRKSDAILFFKMITNFRTLDLKLKMKYLLAL